MRLKRLLSGALAGTLAVISSGLLTVQASAAGDVAINEANFPDETFRNYVSTNFDNGDGVLSQAECQRVSQIELRDTDCSSLKGIEHFPYLDHLICFGGTMTSIDVSKNTWLSWLSLADMPLNSIDVSKNTRLTLLGCNNVGLTEIDVSKNTELETLDCCKNNLTSLDVTNNPKLKSLSCTHNKLKSLDLSKNPRLYDLLCNNNSLLSLDLSNNPALSTLWCGENKLTSLDLSKNPAISSISLTCDYNRLNIGEATSEFDLTQLEKFGFDISKASNWSYGVRLEGKTIKNIGGAISYTYSTGSKPVTFYLYCSDPADDLSDPNDPNDPDPVPDDGSPKVWVNGKDVKDRKDESKSVYYKTYTYQSTGMYSGGKWCVAVTTSKTDSVDKFLALFTDGRLNTEGKKETADGKKLANARIKDGKITVTAGKDAGTANIWLYEVKGKKIICDDEIGVKPQMTAIPVFMAPGSPVLAETLTDGKADKGVTKLDMKPSDSKTLLIGDKKAAFTSSARFRLTNQSEDVASAVLSGNKLTVTALKAGRTNITLTSVQSGRSVKLAVTCKE